MNKMAKMGLALTLLTFPAANKLFGQTTMGEIQGKVVEGKTGGVPELMVWVEVLGDKVKVMTDNDGRYVIKPMDAGTYTLFVPNNNNNDTIKQTVVVNSNSICFVNTIDLLDERYKAKEIEGATVIAWKDPLIDKSGGGTMEIMRAKELKHIPQRRDIKQLVGVLTSGAKVNENGDAYVRGSRADATIYFVDGVKLREGFKSPPASAIASVAVYTGGVPAKYGDCTGGVVVVETQSYFNLYNEWINQQNR